MNTVNASTGYSGFELHMGRSPRIIPPLVEPIAGSDTEEFHVVEVVEQITAAVDEAKDNMLLAKVQQAYHANKHRGDDDVFMVGDRVMLSTLHR